MSKGVARPLPGRRNFLALTAAAALQACAAEPDVDAYLASSSDPEPLQRHYALQQALSDSPLVFGNQTRLLRDGAQAFPAMFQAMQQARDHINLEYFIFEDVAVGGLHLSDLLIGKLNRGVTVNIIYRFRMARTTRRPPCSIPCVVPAPGSSNSIRSIRSVPWRAVPRTIGIIARSWWSMGAIGFAGGINLARTYENPPSAGFPADGNTQHAYWRDTAMEIQGPAVAELQRLFFDTWKQQRRRSGTGGQLLSGASAARACRPSGSSAADQAISGRSIISRSNGRSARRTGASGCPPAISCRRTSSGRIWQRRRDAASI